MKAWSVRIEWGRKTFNCATDENPGLLLSSVTVLPTFISSVTLLNLYVFFLKACKFWVLVLVDDI